MFWVLLVDQLFDQQIFNETHPPPQPATKPDLPPWMELVFLGGGFNWQKAASKPWLSVFGAATDLRFSISLIQVERERIGVSVGYGGDEICFLAADFLWLSSHWNAAVPCFLTQSFLIFDFLHRPPEKNLPPRGVRTIAPPIQALCDRINSSSKMCSFHHA